MAQIQGRVMDDLKQKYLSRIADAGDEAALEDIRLAAVGKKGEVSLKMRELCLLYTSPSPRDS